MRALGVLLAVFGGGGLITCVTRYLDHLHVEPMGLGLFVMITAGGVLLFRLGSARARAAAERVPEQAVLKVAGEHHGRVTAVLVAAEAKVPIAVAERELAAMADAGACVRRTDEAGACFLFPEMESEEVKRKLFFADAEAKRGQKVGS